MAEHDVFSFQLLDNIDKFHGCPELPGCRVTGGTVIQDNTIVFR